MNQQFADTDLADREDLSYLCKRCRKLDFDSIFSRRRVQVGGDPILWFDSKHTAFVDERCAFCQAMRFIHPSLGILPEWERKRTPLVVTTYQDAGGEEDDVQDVTEDNVCLTFGYHRDFGSCVFRHVFRWTKHNIDTRYGEDSLRRSIHEWVGYLAEKRTMKADEDALPAFSIQPQVNFEMVNKRLKECREKHDRCKRKRGGYMQRVPGMRLIDCRTRTVVPAPKGPVSYAALSYVWGDSEEMKSFSEFDFKDRSHKLPDPLPNTISDAILVSRNLKIRYLWVDRYCILQDATTKEEKDEKHGQIARMHQIYGGASITIIAAAGNGPGHGLPGVTKLRSPPIVRLPGRTLFATLPDPKLLVDASAWSKRGWTFQEGMLARRLLVFTEQQVYFQCGHTADAEAWEECGEELFAIFGDDDDNTPLYPYFSLGSSVWPRIDEYIGLHMRYPRDILNGILGVLAHYQKTLNIRHVAGLPIDPKLSDSILWPQEFAYALSWGCNEPGERRAGFPTWSWTGWTCKGFKRNEKFDFIPMGSVKEWSIFIEGPTAESSNQCDLASLLDGGHDLSQARFLRVSAPSLEAEIIPMDPRPRQQGFIVNWNSYPGGFPNKGFDNNMGSLCVRYSGDEEVSLMNMIDSTWKSSRSACSKIPCFAMIVDETRLNIPTNFLASCCSLATAVLVIKKEDGWFEKIGVSYICRQKLRRIGSVVRTFRLR